SVLVGIVWCVVETVRERGKDAVAGSGQARGRAIDHLHGTSRDDRRAAGLILTRQADGQVFETVIVEIAARQRVSEVVPRFIHPVVGTVALANGGLQGPGVRSRTTIDIDRTTATRIAVAGAIADGDFVDSIAVEIAG